MDLISYEADISSIQGGYLGFYCTHKYAHTSGCSTDHIHYALKGLDAVIFAIFHGGLGLKVSLRPVLDDLDVDWEYYGIDRANGDIVGTRIHELKLSSWGGGDESPIQDVSSHLSVANGVPPLIL